MGREIVLFKSEEKKTAREISDTLRLIADKIDGGTLTLKQGKDEVLVEFPEQMGFELKVEEEQGQKRKKSFEIELEWVIGAPQADGAQIL